ncbi:MAG: class I SAM-dependent methyltransferase [Planctomycetota bacterium]|jgi:ubiquinone/menaquinone biosynthesis C-methylase UbiE
MSKSQPWYETFFDGLYGKVLAGNVHEDRAASQAELIKKVLKLRKGQRVLDCPCGVGRITFALAELGLRMTGVDLTAGFVTKARRKAKRRGLDIPFVRCDMREIDFDGEFAAVINWFTSFGYFDDAGNLAAARAFFRALRPGGKLLIEMSNRSWVLSHFTPSDTHVSNGVQITDTRQWDPDTGCMESDWTFRKGKQVERQHVSLRLYDGAELRAVLRQAGFREIHLYSYPPLGRVSRRHRRLMAVATRPKESSS